MLLDVQDLVSDAQDLAQTAAAYLSTYSIDLGAAGTDVLGGTVLKDVGRGKAPLLLIQVVTTFTSGGAATVKFEIVTADNAALTTNLTVVQTTAAIAIATLIAGYQVQLGVPPGITQRYLGCRYTIGSFTTTAGKVTAGIVVDKQTNPTVTG